ncbi:hypothetical protein NPIL_698281, partial [Nephila pilipes]
VFHLLQSGVLDEPHTIILFLKTKGQFIMDKYFPYQGCGLNCIPTYECQ